MQIYVIGFLSILYISLIFYLSLKKRIKLDNVIHFSKLFLIFYIICMLLISALMLLPFFIGIQPKAWTVVILTLLLLVCFICIIWYKNFYILYEEEYFIYSNIFAKSYKIYYSEVEDFSSKGDIIFIEAKNKDFYILNSQRFVPNVKQFITLLRNKKG